ncbi:alkyl sulfatase C-terminal domain-containing protein [Streptomyces sp. CC208A]|uniref:alkyl sulfatase C-terminal domain-containing protein n=1 Tax=Streptomyces sp. CC208A TaxID=3044573 RepID=UPI0024A968A7|nr:alkyl sulfatase C-terminal domain-containing protein [Streptomyces sp. CC208A]
MPIDILFDFAAVHLIGDKAADADLRIDFRFTDHSDETWTMWVAEASSTPGAEPPDARLAVAGSKAALVGTLLKPASAPPLAQAEIITLEGDEAALQTLAGLLDDFDPGFPIVTP